MPFEGRRDGCRSGHRQPARERFVRGGFRGRRQRRRPGKNASRGRGCSWEDISHDAALPCSAACLVPEQGSRERGREGAHIASGPAKSSAKGSCTAGKQKAQSEHDPCAAVRAHTRARGWSGESVCVSQIPCCLRPQQAPGKGSRWPVQSQAPAARRCSSRWR